MVDLLNTMVAELLGHPIDPDDNYFTAGLDSATVVRLHTLMIKRLEMWVPVMGLFRRPTLRRTAEWLVEARAAVERDEAARRADPPATDRAEPAAGRSAGQSVSRRDIRAQIRRDGTAR
ncbi:acyl carrier protein [Micromonospora sp. CPCC 206060]|uniref:acyl carrier protein n=1 Tax=Micromonospora sp. CPCC 206060 TaxID=3122406 RepID=UPI002FF1602F